MIQLAGPTFSPGVVNEISQVLADGQLVQGSRVEEFERESANFLGAKYSVAVMNGTSALELALIALGIGPGNQVAVPAYSFVASASAVVRVGATPVFVDVRSADLTMDPDLASDLIEGGHLDAILPVDEFGFPSDVSHLKHFDGRVVIVEDAACAFGTESNPRIGAYADAWCYSLHPRKVLTSGEGGLICTNNDDLAASLRLYRNHGMVKSEGGIDCVTAATNARMTEIQAILAWDQLQTLGLRLDRRRQIASYYNEELSGSSMVLPEVPAGCLPNWQTFLVRFPSSETRDSAARSLARAQIGSSVGAQCIPAMSWYGKSDPTLNVAAAFPNAWNAWKTGLAIPLHESMSDHEVERVVEALQAVKEIR